MRSKFSIWLFVAAVVIIPVSLFIIVRWYENVFQALPVLGPPGHTVNGFSLADQHGRNNTLADWENKIVIANFFFTHCSAICPKMMYQLKRVQAFGGKEIHICSFSADPLRDSVGRLEKYAALFSIKKNWSLFTGDKKELYRFARKDLMIVATDGDGGPDDFIHSENLVLIDPQKRIRGFYKGTDENDVNKLIHDIEKLQKEVK